MGISSRSEQLASIGSLALIVLGLYLSSLYSYLLFHSLIEIATIAVAFTLFILTWNTRRYLTNNYLRLLGIGYSFIAMIDLLHTLAYKGMGLFPGYGANLATQLWIAARYLQAVTLLAAPLFMVRRVSNHAIFGGYAVSVSALLAMVYSGNFPDCFIEGKGLTTFKISSEYVITALLLISLYLLYGQRRAFKESVFWLTAASIACTAFSEIAFTTYASVYGFANLVGHFSKLAAFYLVYRAIVVTGLKEPFDLIFRDLKQTEEALRLSQNTLEEKVKERTFELRTSEARYRSLVQKVQTAIVLHDGQGRILVSNPMAQELLRLSEEQLQGKSLVDPDWHFLREDGSVLPVAEYPVSQLLRSRQPFRSCVMGISRPSRDDIAWVLVNAEPEYDDAGQIVLVVVSFVDITELKRTEEALHRLNRQLRAISTCNQVMMQASDEQTLLDEICRIVCDVAGYRMAWVGYPQDDDARTIRPVAWAGVEEGYLAEAGITWADTERGRGPTGRAIREGVSACIQDFATDPHAGPWRQIALQRGYRSSTALPLKDEGGTPFGALCIYSAQPGTFTLEEMKLLDELAGNLAFGITTLRIRDERKKAGMQILASEQLFRALVENSPDFIARYDREFRRIYVNPAIQKLFGGQTQNAIGRTPADQSPLYAPQIYMDHLRQVIETGAESTAEIPFRTAHGEMHWGHMRFVPEFDQDGKVLSVLAIGRDIHEIKENEQRFRMLAENFPDFVMRFDRHGHYTYVNPAVEKAFGLPVQAIVGKTLQELPQHRRPEQNDELLALIRRAFDEGVANESEAHWETMIGKRIFEIRHAPEKDAAGNVVSVLSIARDITERRQAEAELHESEARFRRLTENAPDIIYRMSLPDGKYEYISPAVRSMLGYAPEKFYHNDHFINQIIHPDWQNYLHEQWNNLLKGEMPPAYEYQCLHKSGQIRWLNQRNILVRDDAGNPIAIEGIVTDITDRKMMEEQLKASEERLRLTLEATQIGIWDWDVLNDRYYASPIYYTMLGYEPKEGPADRGEWVLRVHPDDRQTVLEQVNSVLSRTSDEYSYEARFRHADGSYKWHWALGYAAERDKEGKLTRMLGLRIDIDKRKQMEKELAVHREHLEELVRERTAELEAANKELDAFAYSVSHDLRAPLRHIDGFLQLLQKKAVTVIDEQSRRYMAAISDSAQKMGLLIDDLLAFSRMGRKAMAFDQVVLAHLVRGVIRDLEPEAAGRDIEWRIGDLPAVGGDAAMLRIVLANLISNALKFTRPRQGAQIEIGSMPGQPSEAVIFVHDNGVGFDMTYVDKLFGVFQRLHRSDEFEGTGIGLASVRRIIARHGGRTWAEGALDQGATFYFSLPNVRQRGGDE